LICQVDSLHADVCHVVLAPNLHHFQTYHTPFQFGNFNLSAL